MDGWTRSNGHEPEEQNWWNRFWSVWLVLQRLNASAEVETEKEENIIISISAHPLFFPAQISGQSALSSNQNCQILRRAKLVETANSRLQLLRTNGVFLALGPGFAKAVKKQVDC